MSNDERNKKDEKSEKKLTPEQKMVVKNKKKRLVVSASAGSGKTFVVVEKLIGLICKEKVPVSRLLVLTFTKAAASELKSRLYTEILNQQASPFLIEQLDEIMVSDISTIDSFCEKVIKRNINKLDLPQNFAILDEKTSQKLKRSAFQRAFENYSFEKSKAFEEIYFSFKRNEDALFECVQTLQSFFDSDKDGKKLQKDFVKNLTDYHNKACQNLICRIKKSFEKSKNLIDSALLEADMMGEKLASGQINFVDRMQQFLKVDFSKDYFSICKEIAVKIMPALSTAKCDRSIKEKFARAKDEVLPFFDLAKSQALILPNMIEMAEKGTLAGAIMDFFEYYSKEYRSLKEKRGTLDFADIERYAKRLLEDDEVKKSLQSCYDYIIIDEYQDTNRLQEAILKPIAEGGFFIAVGDIKQGIYGFRNASKEIMSQDIENFPKNDGQALFLRGNFRTDERVLDFINKIFVKLMTIESVGINYEKTSILEGKNKFLPNDLPAVSIDIVYNGKEKNEDADKNTDKEELKPEDEWKEIYSVENDEMQEDFDNYKEIVAITHRIDEALTKQIYSPKLKAFRQVEQGDIALLFRSRSTLMQELVRYLQTKGYSVTADIKENLLEDSQIALIHALIKLTINENDDIPLASVMASPFGAFSFEEMGDIRKGCMHGSFYEAVKNLQNKKIDYFFNRIKEFKFNIQVFGIIKAIEKMFASVDYFEYLQSFEDYEIKRLRINRLFALIRSNDLDFSPQELVSQLESATKEDKTSCDGGNSITVTTIHATKGLEYPIVIICGAGEKLGKVYNKNYIANKEYGLGSHLYSFEDNLRIASPVFLAGKFAMQEREFVDELMLFYVAMTRAQNHLYIIGSGKEKDYSFAELQNQNSYLKLIFYALGENVASQVFEQEMVETQNVKYSVVTDVEDDKIEKETQDKSEHENVDISIKELDALYDYQYPNKNLCRLSYKNSVTGVNKLYQKEEYKVGETLFSEEGEQKPIEETAKQKLERKKAVEIGNSYHEALKLIDFNAVVDEKSLQIEFEKIKSSMQEGYASNIDLGLLLKNILLVKDAVKDGVLYKEREFIMESTPQEIGLISSDEIEVIDNDQTLIVQGIIDLFALGKKTILIDYKYTNTRDEQRLIERYYGQIELYSQALKKGFGKGPDEKYLLSLKEGRLIKIE